MKFFEETIWLWEILFVAINVVSFLKWDDQLKNTVNCCEGVFLIASNGNQGTFHCIKLINFKCSNIIKMLKFISSINYLLVEDIWHSKSTLFRE